MKRLITFVGFKSSGKDTAAQPLIENGFLAMSYADAVKDAIAAIFCWDRALLEGVTEQSRQWREQVDHWWAEKLNVPLLTPRWVMRNFGTEVMRQHFNPDIWMFNVERRIGLAGDRSIVIRDARFPNEIQLARRHGGELVRIRRGDDPEWIETAMHALAGDRAAVMLMNDFYKVHSSEWAWLNEPVDFVIDNDGDIASLQSTIRGLFATESVR